MDLRKIELIEAELEDLMKMSPQEVERRKSDRRILRESKDPEELRRLAYETRRKSVLDRRAAMQDRRLANFDPLIGEVGSKKAYLDLINSGKHKGKVWAAVDLNHFKQVNENWGHDFGDDVIRTAGQTLHHAARSFGGKVYRTGGDEFRIAFDKPEDAMAFTRHARRGMEQLPAVVKPIKPTLWGRAKGLVTGKPADIGVWQHSMSIGLGQTPEEADVSQGEAKKAKNAKRYAPGMAQTHVHSLLPGRQGHMPQPERPEGIKAPTRKELWAAHKQAGMQKSEEPTLSMLHNGDPMVIWTFGTDVGFLNPEEAIGVIGAERMAQLAKAGISLTKTTASKVWISPDRTLSFEP